jgi:hypothetical protein
LTALAIFEMSGNEKNDLLDSGANGGVQHRQLAALGNARDSMLDEQIDDELEHAYARDR